MAAFVQFDKKSVAIVILAIISVAVLAYVVHILPGEQNNPHVNISVSRTADSIQVTHKGGDSIAKEHLLVSVNEQEIPPNLLLLQNNGDWPFSIGEIMYISYPSQSDSIMVQIHYVDGNNGEILYSDILPITSPIPAATAQTPEITPIPTPTPIPISTLGIPEALFTATPLEGPVPLTVQFSDQSTGIPEFWSWTFGDGGTSEEQNPVHTYLQTGRFSVSLNVGNRYEAQTRIVQEYVNVTPARPQDVAISAETEGFIRPGGFAQFSVTAPGSRIKIGGQVVRPKTGDEIRLVVKGDGKGSISISEGQISDFTFDRVELGLNGEPAGSGALQEIYITSFADLLTTLVLEIPPSTGAVRITTGGNTVLLLDTKDPVMIINLIPDDSGLLVLDTGTPYQATYRGAAGSVHS